MMTYSISTYLPVGTPISGMGFSCYPDGNVVELINTTVDEPIAKTLYFFSWYNNLHITSILHRGETLNIETFPSGSIYESFGVIVGFKVDDWKAGESIFLNLDHVYNGEMLGFDIEILPRKIKKVWYASKTIIITEPTTELIGLTILNENQTNIILSNTKGVLIDTINTNMFKTSLKVAPIKSIFKLPEAEKEKKIKIEFFTDTNIDSDIDIVLFLK